MNINARCSELVKFWSLRNTMFKRWYDVITLKDVLAQEGMESFVSNDPRTFYNLALSLLDPGNIPHTIPTIGLTTQQISATSLLERLVGKTWRDLGTKNRRRGRPKPITEIVRLLLATGWYSVLAIADPEVGLTAEVWNPVEVYPNWTDDGMVECAHVYKITAEAANAKCEKNGWGKPSAGFKGQYIEVKDYWLLEGGVVSNAVLMGTIIPKPLTATPFEYIPIFVAPIGGLPDRGAITGNEDWKKDIGQSIVAANMQVYENYNKQLTFLQQLMRDTATPRWFEQSTGEDVILKKEDMFKRGAIFRGGPEDRVAPLPTPPIPVELQSTLFHIQNMIQRGSLPWQLYGQLQETVSTYLLTQVASAAKQMLRAFHEGVVDVLTDVDNFWIEETVKQNIQPGGFQIPQNLPEDTFMTAAYDIQIPGDLVLRATVARMLSPGFELSATTAMDLLFPEIANPQEEYNRVIADKAEKHPVAVAIQLAQSFRDAARQLQEDGQGELAALYQTAYAVIVQTLGAGAAMQPAEEREAGGARVPMPTFPGVE